MPPTSTPLTGVERFFDPDTIIVSKTDLKGRITYANDTFIEISGYTEDELMGQPHSILRHPDMPRCVFKLLWDTLQSGNEIFAYVINKARNGDHYWVLAHVTPTFKNDKIIGYHSSRRVPRREAIAAIAPVYKSLLQVESGYANAKEGMQAGFEAVVAFCKEKGMSYEELVLTL